MRKLILFLSAIILFSCKKTNNTIETSPVASPGDTPNQSKNNNKPDGSLTDKNIKYIGRWNFSNATQFSSYWGGAYFKVNFTGQTAKIKLDSTITTNYYVKIDNGKWISYTGQSGLLNATPVPLKDGVHTLTVAQGEDYNYTFKFRGLILDSLSTTQPLPISKNLIEYIGDSITAGYLTPQANVSDYAWICAELLGAEHTQIAYPGICLSSGYPGAGMDKEYLKQQSPDYSSSPNWDFSKYTPTMVVCNLGVNDENKNVPDATFKNNYYNLLKNIRVKFPNAQIFVMRTFTGAKSASTLAAVNEMVAANDSKIHFINTSGWLTDADYYDGIHPSLSGQIKAASLLKKVLAPYML